MSDNSLINGDDGQLMEWNQINWGKANKIVKNLRLRIFRARELGQWKQVRNLQKLLIRSRANLLLAVRQITQINKGRNTAGVDKEVIKTPEDRVKLVRNWENKGAKPTKRVYIPKASGKKRPLGIPTIKDRVAQAIVKNALEPEWESMFEANSYGFRPGRGCHDAIEQCFIRLRKGGDTWVLDADIKGFFDNIAHEAILRKIGSFPKRDSIREWLKSGFIDKGGYNPTKTGTPQGGVISPILANIGLHGLEKYVKQINPKLGVIRYADDFVVTSKDKASLEAVLIQLKRWLSERGLEISEEKTKILPINEGFDFLGFNIRQYRGKLLIKPQKDLVLKFCRKIKEELRIRTNWTQEAIIAMLNPILRGFANYYRSGVSKKTFDYIENRIWHLLYRWAKRRHPNKSKKWVLKRYFGRHKGRSNQFMCKGTDRKGNEILLVLYDISSTPIIRHIKVKGVASPDDPSLREYWYQRSLRNGKNYWTNGSKYHKVARQQCWICPVCKEPLFNGENVETHHIVPVKQGGTDDPENLVHLHRACHKQVHSINPRKKA